MNDDESYQQAHAVAVGFLSHRARSEAEIRARLGRRFPLRLVERVIKGLVAQGFVDDAAFARLWTSNRTDFKPRSSSAIKHELLSKGIASDIAEATTKDVDDLDSAYRAGSKPARQLELSDYSTFRRRLWGYLRWRGFSPSVIRETITRLWVERPVDPGYKSDVC